MVEDRRGVICGVCGRVHEVDTTQSEQNCPVKKKSYSLIFGKVRTKNSRGSKKDGTRTIKLRAIHGDGEKLHEWQTSYDRDIEAKGRDEFALAIYDGRITTFHNFTVDHYTVFSVYYNFDVLIVFVLVLAAVGFVLWKVAIAS